MKNLNLFKIFFFAFLLTFCVESVQAAEMNVEIHTEDDIRNYIHSYNFDSSINYSIEPILTPPYNTGKLTNSTQQSAVNTLNLVRYIAGLDYNVTINDRYAELAQAATLINAVNRELTHHPTQPNGMSNELYSIAYKGASSSNIAMGYENLDDAIIHGWMKDSSYSNIDRVGHRRWILNPYMKEIGFGVTNKYFAMYAFDRSNSTSPYKNVAWPAQNMPIEYFSNNTPWSLSTGNVEDISKVKVLLKRTSDQKVWEFSNSNGSTFYVNNGGYGQKGCIIFRPDDISYNGGDIFEVTITGLKEGTLTYNVRFFYLYPVTEIKLEKTFITLDIEDYYYLHYLIEAIIPSNAGNKDIIWTSSDNSIATIDLENNLIVAVAPGTAVITATNVSSGVSATLTVHVPAGEIITKSDSYTINKGKTIDLEATHSLEHELTFSSTNKSVVTVDEYGIVTGKSKGMAYIIVTDEKSNITKKIKITVKTQSISGLKDKYTIKKGKTLTIKFKTKNMDGLKVKASATMVKTKDKWGFTYLEDGIYIEKVTNSLVKIKGVKKGTVKLTIKAGSAKKTVKVKIQ